MLTFVGLGLYDERSVTIAGRDAIRGADRVFAEFYTSILAGTTIEDLEAYHDTCIEVRDRAGVEETPDPVLDAAATHDIVFLTAGDPLIATTHVDLRLRAHDRGIPTRIVHGTSAHTAAAGLTALQTYRFGKATTLPFPGTHTPDPVPPSVHDTITDNLDRGLHTLVYLDINVTPTTREFLTASDAARTLAETGPDRLAVAVARAGSPDPLVRADRLSRLATHGFGGPLHLLIVPGRLDDLEAEALRAFAHAPDPVLNAHDPRNP